MRPRYLSGVLAALAAAGGIGVATVLPASADTTTGSAPTVYAYTIPGASTTDAIAISPAVVGNGVSQEWILNGPPSEQSQLLGVSSLPSAPSPVPEQSLGSVDRYDGVDAESNSGNSLVPVSGNAVGVSDGALYEITSYFGDAEGNEISDGPGDQDDHAGVGMAADVNDVFTSDGSDTVDVCSLEGSGCSPLSLPEGWTASGVDGLASEVQPTTDGSNPAGPAVLFSDSNDEIGELTAAGAVTGPWDTGHVSPAAGGIATVTPVLVADPTTPLGFSFMGEADTWFAWKPTVGGPASELAFVPDANPGATPTVYGPAQGMPTNAVITALTFTPNGNVVFCDAANNAIGELDLTTETITETPLPTGFTLPSDRGAIEPGNTTDPMPDTAYFYAESGSTAAIGEVQGSAGAVFGATTTSTDTTTSGTTSGTDTDTDTDTTPSDTTTGPTTTTAASPASATTAPTTTTVTVVSTKLSRPATVAPTAPGVLKLGVLRFASATASVSHQGMAALKVSCSTAGICGGRLTLTREVTTKVTKKVHGRRRTVSQTTTQTLGSVSYGLAPGTTQTLSLKLSRTASNAVTAAKRRTLAVTAEVVPILGSNPGAKVTLVGASAAAKST